MTTIRHFLRIFALITLVVVTKVVVYTPLAAKNAVNITDLAKMTGSMNWGGSAHPPFHELIKDYSNQYGVDYRLIYALIKQESKFDTSAVSEKGASGLMQVMPAVDLSDDSDAVSEDAIDLTVPEENIKAGVSYFASMLQLFERCPYDDRIQLALAAYNAGPSRIYDAQEIAAFMGDNPNSWTSVRNALPLLSKRCYSLHKLVWNDARPRNGYFGDSRQTIGYVDKVMKNYAGYRQMYRP